MPTPPLSLQELEPTYQTIAAAQARLIEKGSCLDGLYSVGILLQYITALKAQTSGPFAQGQERAFQQLQLDYFAMKQRAEKAEYAAADHVKTEANIALATDEKYSEHRARFAAMQRDLAAEVAGHDKTDRELTKIFTENDALLQHTATIIQGKDADIAALKAQNTSLKDDLIAKAAVHDQTDRELFRAIKENGAMRQHTAGLKDELAEQEKQKLTLIRELEASEKYRHLLTKAVLHSTNAPPEPAS